MEEVEKSSAKLEIPPSTLAKLIKEEHGDDVITTQTFKTEYAKSVKAFVHFLSSMASDECMDQGRAKVTPGDLKSVLADFNLEFLCDGLDIKDTPVKKSVKKPVSKSKEKPESKDMKRKYNQISKNTGPNGMSLESKEEPSVVDAPSFVVTVPNQGREPAVDHPVEIRESEDGMHIEWAAPEQHHNKI